MEVLEGFERGPEAQYFAWHVVELLCYVCQFFTGDLGKRLLFREDPADESIELFDRAALPRMVPFAEVELCL